MSIITGTTALASINVEGGTWDYGFKDVYLTVYSDYYHGSSIHGSSVQGAWFDSDYNVSAGAKSKASADAAISNNHCYYTVGKRGKGITKGVTLPDVNMQR